jgi:hypothetical protein
LPCELVQKDQLLNISTLALLIHGSSYDDDDDDDDYDDDDDV